MSKVLYEQTAGRVMVALDFATVEAAEALIQQIEGIPCYLKVGMELYYATGPDFVRSLKYRGFSVFLDLKMHDIPNTVRAAASVLTSLGVDMMNVHAAGGSTMMQNAAQAAAEKADMLGIKRPKLIAVTQLTSTAQKMMNDEIGIPGSIRDSVQQYAALASQAGLDGVVCSPWEAAEIKRACGSSFLTVTPGVRPEGVDAHDQKRIATPKKAVQLGSDFLVIGRAITQADDPRKSLGNIIKEMMSE